MRAKNDSFQQGHRYVVHFVIGCAGPGAICSVTKWVMPRGECQVHRPCRKMKIRLSFGENRAHGKRESNTRRRHDFERMFCFVYRQIFVSTGIRRFIEFFRCERMETKRKLSLRRSSRQLEVCYYKMGYAAREESQVQ